MNPIWMLARGSGVAAYVLLSVATVWGLLLASKVLDRSASARDLTWVHESLSLAAVASTAVHMVSLWLEEFIDFDLRHLLIPGASDLPPGPRRLGGGRLLGASGDHTLVLPAAQDRATRLARIALRHVRLLPGGGPPWDHRRYRHRATRHGGPLRHHSDRGAWANRAPVGQGGSILLTPGGGRRGRAGQDCGERCSHATCQTAYPARVA